MVYPSESLAQKFVDHLDITFYGYLRRSLYVSTWDDKGDEDYKDNYKSLDDESVNGQWYDPRDWGKWDEALWNPDGAYKKPTHGNTPGGLPEGLYKFQKGKTPKLN